ncbi:hypothetical protein VOLCADRAFT_87128 [Volvox carteri f. nagariensis]|uniref:Peptidase S8/S53 domain-containing protein n=1 Tax=Volvox carteri f. nagariensis TaxID=3068 RepID=D8TK88_VOLCA|nr:uncharacterized protein VOLCADRAFT_87128 [Volvox carteri f. nagariensis]EFJ52205.1 hypothetical protein VOLCADRAFT_87128 [Volvox carteri f. nagariensis]|eukprot:XP_002946979.1 hypothetical protein VOLCADRAFT_87128 [Volvox carteri f. nagariensis]
MFAEQICSARTKVLAPLVGGNYTGKVVVVDMGMSQCAPGVRAANVKNSTARAAIYIRPDGSFASEALTGSNELINVIMFALVTKAHGEYIKAVLNDPRNLNVHLQAFDNRQLNVGVDSIAAFSSRGPLADGRIKPDIVAPGDPVLSALSTGTILPGINSSTCSNGNTYLSGTSMATPMAFAIAGAKSLKYRRRTPRHYGMIIGHNCRVAGTQYSSTNPREARPPAFGEAFSAASYYNDEKFQRGTFHASRSNPTPRLGKRPCATSTSKKDPPLPRISKGWP